MFPKVSYITEAPTGPMLTRSRHLRRQPAPCLHRILYFHWRYRGQPCPAPFLGAIFERIKPCRTQPPPWGCLRDNDEAVPEPSQGRKSPGLSRHTRSCMHISTHNQKKNLFKIFIKISAYSGNDMSIVHPFIILLQSLDCHYLSTASPLDFHPVPTNLTPAQEKLTQTPTSHLSSRARTKSTAIGR